MVALLAVTRTKVGKDPGAPRAARGAFSARRSRTSVALAFAFSAVYISRTPALLSS